MQVDLLNEARRQAEICNACRYCENYCAVFPALHEERSFSDENLTQLANLCHNCQGCYYACQFTAPHEFDMNLPAALADVRHASWEEFAYPRALARIFQKNAMMSVIALVLGFAALFGAVRSFVPSDGEGFYAILSHSIMVAIFTPAFVLPLLSIGVGLRRYWHHVGGGSLTIAAVKDALTAAASMKNLSGGHGDGCNFEDEDRFSHARRNAHHAVMYGFLLCFASTSSATILHYIFDMPAPYGLFSLPKLLGLLGGILLTVGCGWLVSLKLRADKNLGAGKAWGAEVAYILLLGFVGLSGLLLYILGQTFLMPTLLVLHLGSVLTFFLLMPYTKMAHGFYRLAALIRNATDGN